MKEELTELMHSEFTVSEETDIKHRAWTAEGTIEKGLFTIEEACKAYRITIDQYNKYKETWKD